MTGFPSTVIPPEFIELVEKYRVGNVILFSENIESLAQLKRLCREIQELVQRCTGQPALIAVDQEGGVVTRMPSDAANVPGAMALAATGNPELAFEAGRITGEELRDCGVNFNLAPDVDVNSNSDNPVIGVRSYGDRPETVIQYSGQMLRGLQAGGVLCAVKHFPGHGDTSVDSHMGLPIVNKPLFELEQTELPPFQAAIADGTDAVMTSHILFPQLEPKQLPATMSKAILTDLLRVKLGFQGIIITDCLEMGAITQNYGTSCAALHAISAGADILCISHTPASVAGAAEEIYRAVRKGALSEARLDEAVQHIVKGKNKLISRTHCHPVDYDAHKKAVRQMLRNSLTLVRGTLPPLGRNPLFIGCYAYRSTLASTRPDRQVSFAEYLSDRLGGSALITSINPDEEEILHAVKQSAHHSCIVLGTYNGHISRGQIQLANRLCEAVNNRIIVVALRNPYDLALIDEKAACIAAYEYSVPCFEALAELLSGTLIPRGTLSVTLHGPDRNAMG